MRLYGDYLCHVREDLLRIRKDCYLTRLLSRFYTHDVE